MKNAETVARVRNALLCMQRYSWEQGVCAQAFLESGERDLAILAAHDAVVRQGADGRLGVMGADGSVVDAAGNGEAVRFAAAETGDPAYAKAAERMEAWLLLPENRNPDGILYHVTNAKQIWVDSFYMAPPFLAVSGRWDEAVRQVEGFRRILWNPAARLFSHIWDDGAGAFVRKAFWGVGNGWAAAGMVRVIAALPDSHAGARKRLVGYVREAIDGFLPHVRPDGLAHDVLDDPASFVETNAVQMIAYSIYRLVSMGELNPSYLDHADKMRKAANGMVDTYGLVQGVCGAPRFDSPGVAPEGQAFYLLMEAAAKPFDLHER
jgi:unsaturated rhamnogalacturonyl hydrolase